MFTQLRDEICLLWVLPTGTGQERVHRTPSQGHVSVFLPPETEDLRHLGHPCGGATPGATLSPHLAEQDQQPLFPIPVCTYYVLTLVCHCFVFCQ